MAGGALRCRATVAALRGPQPPTANGVAEILPKGGHCPRQSFGAPYRSVPCLMNLAGQRRLVLFDSHKIEHEVAFAVRAGVVYMLLPTESRWSLQDVTDGL